MKQIFQILIFLCIILNTVSDQCDVETSLRTDCGYDGINQRQCESKSCCWKPTNSDRLSGTPWCFYQAGSNPCENITYDGKDGPGFDEVFYEKMYSLFDVNININGLGGVVAAPDHSTPGGDYYYHWMRDAALTMRTYMELNDFNLDPI